LGTERDGPRSTEANGIVGLTFRGKDMANPGRYATDLLADRDLRFISRTFPLWVVVGLALPFGLGVALIGSLAGGPRPGALPPRLGRRPDQPRTPGRQARTAAGLRSPHRDSERALTRAYLTVMVRAYLTVREVGCA
jgi:hypothetical protein